MKKLITLLTFNFLLLTFVPAQEFGWKDLSENIPGDTMRNLSDIAVIGDNIWISEFTVWPPHHIYHSSDGGQIFEAQEIEAPTECIYMLSTTKGFAGGENGRIYYTNNGGSTWEHIMGSASGAILDIDFPPGSDIGFCSTMSGQVGKFDSTHFLVYNFFSYNAWDIPTVCFPVDTSHGWVGGSDNSPICHYSNGTWTWQSPPAAWGYSSIYFLDNSNGWAVSGGGLLGGVIAHTNNGGVNWMPQVHPADVQLLDVFMLDNQEGWVVGALGSILHTVNGGENWNIQAENLSDYILNSVVFTTSTNGFIVGNWKTFLKYNEISGIGNYINGSSDLNLTNYPNPFVRKTVISYQLTNNSKVNLEVFDINGVKVAPNRLTAQSGRTDNNHGEHEVEFDATGLPSGIFYCRLTVGKYSQTKKMILIK